MAENNAKAPEQESNFKALVLPVIVLVVICLVCSALLAVLNDATAPIIEANTKAETLAAYLSVLPEGTTADDLQDVTVTTANVTGAVKTADGMAVVQSTAAGYSGNLVTVYAAFDTTGTLTALSVDASTQTTGIGSKTGEESFYGGYVGALPSRWRLATPLMQSAALPSLPVQLSAPSTAQSTATIMKLRGWLKMAEKQSKWRIFTAGIIRENPVLRLVLGCCSALAVTTTVSGALGMGLAMTFVLVCSNIVISALRKVIPAKVHLPCYIVIIATFVTIVQMVLQAYVPALYKSLGVFLALIVVNCIILGRAEMFACKNSVVDSALDGLGMGCGYILTMLLMSSVREILGNGTWMGITIIPESIDRMSLMNQAPGGFFVFGCLMALCVYIEKKLNKPIERKTCGDVMLEEIDKAKTEEGGAKE